MLKLSPQNRKRLRAFRSIRRGWYSFWLLVTAYVGSLGAELLIGNRPIFVSFAGAVYFPALTDRYYPETLFGGRFDLETDFRALRESEAFRAAGGRLVMPVHPYSAFESIVVDGDRPPARPRWRHPCGTDDRGRDVLARLVYGFRTSISFALVLTAVSSTLGIVIGSVQGYFGGWVDLLAQRLVETWMVLPFLYVVLMVSSILTPTFPILIAILALFGWISVSRYVRAEVLRERGLEYVTAARALGASWPRILFRHVLPNALTPVITLAPFQLVAAIFSLTALDFLGYGLPAPTPSWGELFKQGRGNLESWWLTLFTFLGLFGTLLVTTFIGEAAREAWDPRDRRPNR